MRLIRQGRGEDFGLIPLINDLWRAFAIARRGSCLPMFWWTAALHLRSQYHPLHSDMRIRMDCELNGHPVRVVLRRNQSDLYTFAEIFLRDTYAEGVASALGGNVRTVLDLGAHVGLASLLFATAFPDAHVICVEPQAENIVILYENRDLNKARWEILQCAVAETDGVRQLYRSEWWSSSTIMPNVKEARFDNPHRAEHRLPLCSVAVETVTIESLFKRFELVFVDLLKVDIEGAESLVVNSSAHWLNRVGVLMIDIHDKYVDASSIVASLEQFGFRRVSSSRSRCQVFRNMRAM